LILSSYASNLQNTFRRTLAVVSGALLAGGTLAYAQSSRRRRHQEKDSCTDANGHTGSKDSTSQNGVDGKVVKTRKKKNLLKSLHFLAAILVKKIGPSGTNYLLGLMLTAVSSINISSLFVSFVSCINSAFLSIRICMVCRCYFKITA
jgi:hypothetical protein